MAEQRLQGKRVAALFTNGVEQVEFTEPAKALREAGAEVTIAAPQGGEIKGWNRGQWGDTFRADTTTSELQAGEFDAALLPGGSMNADKLRMDKDAVRFVREMFDAGKPIAAICHAPWLLIEADLVRGRTLTSYPSLKTDIVNAGGFWENQTVVTTEGIVTSRNPDDIPNFNRKMIEEFAEGRHQRRAGQARAATGAGEGGQSVEPNPQDTVAEASFESFPASDPPSFTPGTTTPEHRAGQ